MNKILYVTVVAALVLISCNKEQEPNTPPDNRKNVFLSYDGCTVQNGYLNFESGDVYEKLYNELNSLSYKELKKWNESNGFKSLFKKYQQEELDKLVRSQKENVDYDLSKDFVPDVSKVHNYAIASLLNEDGFLVCENTILLYFKENMYVIPDLNFKLVEAIRNEEETTLPDNVLVEKHTEPLARQQEDQLKSWSLESKPVLVNDKRKEWVYWEALLESTYHFNCNCFDTFAVFRIIGKASKKKLWWSAGFDDEIAWGEITVEACPPAIPVGIGTGKIYNVERMKAERMVWSGAKQKKCYFPNGLNVRFDWSKAGIIFGANYTFKELSK